MIKIAIGMGYTIIKFETQWAQQKIIVNYLKLLKAKLAESMERAEYLLQ
jgi:hypothetical protein